MRAICIMCNVHTEYLKMACLAVYSLRKNSVDVPIYIATTDLWNNKRIRSTISNILRKLKAKQIITNKKIKQWNYEQIMEQLDIDHLIGMDCDMYFHNYVLNVDELFDQLKGFHIGYFSQPEQKAIEIFNARTFGFVNKNVGDIRRLYEIDIHKYLKHLESTCMRWGNFYLLDRSILLTEYWKVAYKYGYIHWCDESAFLLSDYLTNDVNSKILTSPNVQTESLSSLKADLSPRVIHYAGCRNKEDSQEMFDKLWREMTDDLNVHQEDMSLKISLDIQDPRYKTRDIIYTFGLRRGGNHAGASWLLGLYEEPTSYYSNVQVGHPLSAPTLSSSKSTKGKIQLATKFNSMILGIEDYKFYGTNLSVDSLIRSDIKYDRFFCILILRDPFNHFASALSNEYTRFAVLHNPAGLVNMWKQYAKEFLGVTNFLPNKVTFNFNKWFTDVAYRRTIADQLELSFNDTRLNFMLIDSSFDEYNYQENAQNMKVLTRFTENSVLKSRYFEEFRMLFLDKELWQLSERIFGHIPHSENLKATNPINISDIPDKDVQEWYKKQVV